jgi:hypothetical protein
MNPIQKNGYNGNGRTAMLRLKHEVLDRILLRRTKEGRSEDIIIPIHASLYLYMHHYTYNTLTPEHLLTLR